MRGLKNENGYVKLDAAPFKLRKSQGSCSTVTMEEVPGNSMSQFLCHL